MTDRSISVKLRAEVDQYIRSMDAAAKATEGVGTGAEKSSQKATGALGKMVESARQNRETWDKVGTTLTVAGGAVVAFGAAALKTGIQYNTLQQTSRAALTSLLGSARAANAQMDKLDEFARSSPFAKSTFIQAQQQMLAFGIETRKVIPYLDAVQNAVAAAGGSNNDIAEIVATMSKIQSSAKITAEDLNEFGGRGVNAAELIGSQMGMTGAQIREAITDGSLDAEAALDALAKGMSTKFDGAADNVKNTFSGAMDRVKAAWRDFSSDLAEPLVGTNGGGFLVDLLNKAADAMRAFEGLPAPIKNTVTAIAGLAGVGSLLAGGFFLLAPRAIEVYEAFQKLAPAGGKVRGSLAAIGTATAGLAAAYVALSLLAPKSIDGAESVAKITKEMLKAGEAGEYLNSSFSGLKWRDTGGQMFEDIDSAIDRVLNKSWDQSVTDFFGGLFGDSYEIKGVTDQLNSMGQAMADLVDKGRPDLAAEMYDQLKEKWVAAGGAVEDLDSKIGPYTDKLADAATTQELAAQSTETLAGWQQRLAEQMSSMDPAISGQAEALQNWLGSIDAVAQGFTDFSDDLGDAKFSLDGWLGKLEEQATALETWSANIQALVDKGASRELLQTLIDQGPAAAQAVAGLANGTEEDLGRAEAAFGRTQGAADGLKNKLGEAYVLDVQTETAETDVAALAQSVLDKANSILPWNITADGDQARGEGGSTVEDLYVFGQSVSPWQLTADPTKADGTARQTVSTFGQMTPAPFQLSADPFNANRTTNAWLNTPRGTSVSVDADTSPAERAVGRAIAMIRSMTAVIPGIPGGFTGGQVGGIAGFTSGGQVPGTPPADPSRDNVFAMTERGRPLMVRSKEWIQPQPAVEYYGADVMRALQYRQIPKSALAGFAAGGSPSMPQYAYSAPAQGAAPAPSLDLTGLQLVGTLDLGNGLEARMEAVAVGVVDARDRSDAGTRQTVGRVR